MADKDTISVRVEGVGDLHFPSTMKPEEIKEAIRKKYPPKGSSPPPEPPGPNLSPTGKPAPHHEFGPPAKDISRITGREAAGMALDALPTIGAGVAAAVAPEVAPFWLSPLLAAGGGAAGEMLRQGAVKGVGEQNLSGELYQVDPTSKSAGEFVGDVAKTGLEQGAYEFGGKLIGKGVQKVLGGPLHAGASKAENIAVRELNEEAGLNLRAPEIAGQSKWMSRLPEYSIFSQNEIKKKWGEGAANGVTRLNQVLSGLSLPTSPTEVGKTVKGALELSNDIYKQEAARMYQEIDQRAGGIVVNMRGVKAEAQKILDDYLESGSAYPTSGGVGGKAEKMLKEVIQGPDELSFNAAHKWRSNLLQMTPQADELMAGKVPGIAKDMVSKVTDAMDNSANRFDPRVQSLWKEARQFYKDGAALFQHEAITGLMEKDPGAVAASVVKGSPETAKVVRSAILDYPDKFGTKAQRDFADSNWRRFQEQFVRSNILEDPERTGEKFMPADLAKIKERMNDYGPAVMKEVLGGDPTGANVLQNLTRIGDAFSRIDKLPTENRKYAYAAIGAVSSALTAWGGLGQGAERSAMAGIGAVAATEGVSHLINKAMFSKTATNYLLDGIGGVIEQSGNRFVKRGGKILVGAINDPTTVRLGGAAFADIMRAWSIVQEEQSKVDTNREAKKEEESPTLPVFGFGGPGGKKSSGPPQSIESNVVPDSKGLYDYLAKYTVAPVRPDQRPWKSVQVEVLGENGKSIGKTVVDGPRFTEDFIKKLPPQATGIRVSNPDMPGAGKITRMF